MEGEGEYFIATSANNKIFEETGNFKRVTDNSRDTIEGIVQNDQHLIFMTRGSLDKSLNTILEVFDSFIKQIQKDPTKILTNLLYSGGLEEDVERMEEDEGEASHNLLVVGENVKQLYGDAIKNVYSPKERGYSIEFDQARVFYEIVNPNQLAEFWHTEPAAMEQFLMWKLNGEELKSVIIVSKKPMCKFCSAFLLHCFCIEAIRKSDVNVMVFSLPALENIAKTDELYLMKKQNEISPEFFKLRDLLLTVVGRDKVKKSGAYKEVDITMFDKIKADLKGVSGNNLCIYGF
jgi:hypothetical protein